MKKIVLSFSLLLSTYLLQAQNNKSFLWRITAPGSDSSSYVFGTVHLPQERFMKLSDSVYDAVNRTATFYNEIDYMNAAGEMNEVTAFGNKALKYLDSVQKTPSWKRLISDINRVYKQQLTPDDMEGFTKFGQRILLELYNPEPGVTALDPALASFAMVLGKPTKGLERYVTQLSMLYSLLDARLTDSTLLFDDDMRVGKDLADYYQQKNFDSIQKLTVNIHPLYRKIVFDDRNKTMADSVQKAMERSTAFFAIGAGHLMGDAGVISLLRNRGFDVQPVFSSNEISITLMEKLFKTGSGNLRRVLKKQEEKEDLILPPPPPMEKIDDVKISSPKMPVTKRKLKKS